MGPVSSRFIHLLPIIPSSVLFIGYTISCGSYSHVALRYNLVSRHNCFTFPWTIKAGAKQKKQNLAEDTEMPVSGIPALFRACLLRLINKLCSFQKSMEEIFAMAPLLENPPPFPLCQTSVSVRLVALAALCSCTFLLCHTQRQIFLAEAPPCAESSYSLMCFKFVSIFYGGLQPLMQMCNGSCTSALQGKNTSRAWFSFMLVLAELRCTGSVKGLQSGCQGCVKPLCILIKAAIWTRIQSAWLAKGKSPGSRAEDSHGGDFKGCKI